MTANLSETGYQQTKRKLASLRRRLAAIEAKEAAEPNHRAAVVRSYREMMQQYLLEIKLYEAEHSTSAQSK